MFSSTTTALRAIDDLKNTAVWVKQLLTHPRQMGAVAPSSRHLARAMVAATPLGAGPIIELGPGTGAITRALIRSGVVPPRLFALERDAGLAQGLAQGIPGLNVFTVSLNNLEAVRGLNLEPVRVILSSLPWRSLPRTEAEGIAQSIHELLAPGGVLVQYTYGWAQPIPSDIARRYGWMGMPVTRVWGNMPPAVVWRYEAGLVTD